MFLFRRPNTQNWQLEIRFPKDFLFGHLHYGFFKGRHHFTMSLGTPDKVEAAIKAAPFIHQYRIAMYQWKHLEPWKKGHSKEEWAKALAEEDSALINKWKKESQASNSKNALTTNINRQFEDGLQKIDGLFAVVTGSEVTFFGADGKVLRKTKNPEIQVPVAPYVDTSSTAAAFLYFDPQSILPPQFMPIATNPDDEIIETYISDKKLRKRVADEARATWSIYKSKIGKALKSATRKDGRELVQILFEQDLKHATVKKKIGWLAAACAYAIEEDQGLKNNPFAKVMPKIQQGDALTREPLSEEQMAICYAGLNRLSENDQLLWKLLAKTGMRLGEAVSIKQEKSEAGSNIRFVEVGSKTDSSRRRIPLPLDIGLPDKISGALFPGGAPSASKRLNRHIRFCLPESSSEFVVHSLRHRVIDVMRMTLREDPYLARRLVGHAAKDVHEKYGRIGPPMTLLKSIIDKVFIDGGQEAKTELEVAPK